MRSTSMVPPASCQTRPAPGFAIDPRWSHATLLALLLLLIGPTPARAAGGRGGPRQAQAIHTLDLGISRPGGIAYLSDADLLLVLPATGRFDTPAGARSGGLIDKFRDAAGSVSFPDAIANPRAAAYDPHARRLLVLDVASRSVIAIPADAAGTLDPRRTERLAAPRAGILRPAGLTVDPATGEVFVLDHLTRRILRFAPPAADAAEGGAIPEGVWIDLGPLAERELSGLAFHPTRRRLFTLDGTSRTLYELEADGRVASTYDLSAVGIAEPLAMAFAPSGDQTDDPAEVSLFVADPGPATSNRGHVFEVASPVSRMLPATAPTAAVTTLTGTLVRTTLTSQFSPPSPDPSGITYDSNTGRLVISDGEVDEMRIWRNKNVFEASLAGALLRSYDVTSFTHEPTGTAYNRNDRHLFVTDDDAHRVFELDPGSDGLAGTSDDRIVRSFDTRAFSSGDTEGIGYDPANKRLFLADGANSEIYEVRPGSNGVFDGLSPAGDDQVTHFDTAVLGAKDIETVEYKQDTGTLLILGRTSGAVLELTTTGALVSTTDISSIPLKNPAGLAYAPSSTGSGMSYYIVNRAVDNNSDPNENDGTLVEIAVGGSGTPPPPPPPPAGGGTDFHVAAGSDDAEESATGSVSVSSTDLELVYDGGNQRVGLRFTNVTIPRGATVTRAYVQFEADEVQSEVTSLLLQGEAADNAATFSSSSNNVSSRPRTSASVSWSPAAWSTVGETGLGQRTPDLSAVVREIVSRPGWASGNALAIVVTGTGHRTARAYEGKASGAALLHVEAGPSNTAPQVDAGPDQTLTLPSDAALDGTVSDDGLPNPPAAVTTLWTVGSGPGAVTFQNAGAVDTRAAFAVAGDYVLRLTANDGALAATDSVRAKVLAAPVGGGNVVERRIASGNDDAEQSASGSMSLGSSDLELVYDGSNQTVGMRFSSLAIPRGATITNAYIQFKADESQSETTSLTMQGQAVGNAPAFGSASGDISSRARTAASVPWAPPVWSSGQVGSAQRTPQLKDILQEIVNRSDWANGNALVILVTGTGHRTARAYEGEAGAAALLHVEF